jgi:hypothetical protein
VQPEQQRRLHSESATQQHGTWAPWLLAGGVFLQRGCFSTLVAGLTHDACVYVRSPLLSAAGVGAVVDACSVHAEP